MIVLPFSSVNGLGAPGLVVGFWLLFILVKFNVTNSTINMMPAIIVPIEIPFKMLSLLFLFFYVSKNTIVVFFVNFIYGFLRIVD